MKNFLAAMFIVISGSKVFAQAKVMNPGEAYGQLIVLSAADIRNETAKYKSLTPLSVPMFAELPLDLSVVAGTITLEQQNLLSHVQLKSRARQTPNLDISALPGQAQNPLFHDVNDGDFIHMRLGVDGSILLEKSTEQQANDFYKNKQLPAVQLKADLSVKKIFRTEDLSYSDFERVGSKAANYAELARALNTASRTVVRPGFALPFAYYQEFLDTNPKLKDLLERTVRDPLMEKVAKTSYRQMKLKAIQDLIMSDETVLSAALVNEVLTLFDQEIDVGGQKRVMKLRSSTNSEDLPNFNGAGLYDSESYKPNKAGKEKDRAGKEASLKAALKTVYASIWNLRAFEERSFFHIPHMDVKAAVQINPSFSHEAAGGVVVTKNIANDPRYPGTAIYIEAQRGDKLTVQNPAAGLKPAKILAFFDPQNPLNVDAYRIQTLQMSNVADDNSTIMDHDNPNPVMNDAEIKDLAHVCLIARQHDEPILGRGKSGLTLDLEFKVDAEDQTARQVYLKQARPYLN